MIDELIGNTAKDGRSGYSVMLLGQVKSASRTAAGRQGVQTGGDDWWDDFDNIQI